MTTLCLHHHIRFPLRGRLILPNVIIIIIEHKTYWHSMQNSKKNEISLSCPWLSFSPVHVSLIEFSLANLVLKTPRLWEVGGAYPWSSYGWTSTLRRQCARGSSYTFLYTIRLQPLFLPQRSWNLRFLTFSRPLWCLAVHLMYQCILPGRVRWATFGRINAVVGQVKNKS